MSEPCKDCQQHNEYGQRLASLEVRIEDMKDPIRELKKRISKIYTNLDSFCTKKTLIVVISLLITIFGSSLYLQVDTSRDIGKISNQVETIQQTLDKEPWKTK